VSDDYEHVPSGNREEDIAGIFTDLATARIRPPQWVIQDLLPVGLTFLASPPKTGKSSVIMAAACLVSGHSCKVLPDWLSRVPQEGAALVFSAEAEAGELRHMVEHGMGVRLVPRESIMIADDPWAFRLDDRPPGGWPRVKYWLDILKPKLVVLDPLRDFHATDENDAGEMNRLLRPIRQWAVSNVASVVVVHHTKKPGDGHSQYSAKDMRGTSALFGIADGVLMCTPVDKLPNALTIEATFKRARGWTRKIQLAIYDSREAQAAEVLSETAKAVSYILATHGDHTVESLSEALKKEQNGIRDALLQLRRNGMVKETQQGWVRT
jgi:hypothetical protein